MLASPPRAAAAWRSVRGVCEKVLLASTWLAASVAPGCLPALDESLLVPGCRGDAPDGYLDDAEECDDGNAEDGDGCDTTCHVECRSPAVKDPRTAHCYFVSPPAKSAAEARDLCRSEGGAQLVTIRSDAERAVVAQLLAGRGAGARFHTAYALSASSESTLGVISSAIPSPNNLYREPGVLFGTTSGLPVLCSGCYPVSPPGPGTFVAGARLVIGIDGAFAVESADAALPGACERIPVGAPQNRCPGALCPAGANTDFTHGAYRYTYVSTPVARAAAEAACASLGATLLVLATEEEREDVVRYFGGALSATGAWVGLKRGTDLVWRWADGVPDGDGTRPRFWDITPQGNAAMPADCAALVTQSDFYDVGLVRPVQCDGPKAPTLPLLCKAPR